MLLGLLLPLSASAEGIVNVYNWADYILPSVIEQFEAEYDIRVNYDTYDSSELVDARLLAGNTGYDVVIHSGFFAAKLLPIGIFHQLDHQRLRNWHHLDPALLRELEGYDPGNRHASPYMWGTTGFSYNVAMIRARMPDAPVHSAAMIFDPAVAARFADCGISFLDSPLDVIPMALSYLGLDPSSVEVDDLAAAERTLRAVRPYVRYFSSTRMLNDLPNKETCIAISWSGDYATAQLRAEEAGIDIELAYTVPAEGAPLWYDAALIPADAPHLDNAYLFVDFLLRPEVIAPISDFVHYANANRDARQLLSPAVRDDPAIYPDEAVMQRSFARRVIPPKLERRRTRLWSRVKAGI